MSLETKWLEDFLSLAETQNFTRSAELRFTTQSAFSRRIKALEGWAGAQLFHRRLHPVTLTQAGETFRPYAEEALGIFKEAREAVRRRSSLEEGVVTFALTHSLANVFFPVWLKRIEQKIGRVESRLLTVSFDDCMAALVGRGCEFLICHCSREMFLDVDPHEYTSIVVGLDALIPLCAPDREGAPRFAADADPQASYLNYADGSRLGQMVKAHLEVSDIAPSPPTFTSSYADVLKSMALQGYGFAWLLNNESRQEIDDGRLVRAANSEWDVPLEVRIFRAVDPLSKRGEQIWSVMADMALQHE